MSSDPTASDDPDLDGMPTRGAREHLQLFRNHLGEAAHHLWQAAVVSSGCWEPGSPVRAAAAHAKTCMRVLPTGTHSRPLVGEDEVGASEFRRCDCLNSMDVIYPYEPWKQRWDMMIALLILYAAITVPVRIGFQVDAEGWVWTFEMLSSLVFIVDVIFTFRTAYIIDYSFWETRSLPIAQKYMGGWFWIDAPSSIPIELLELVVGEASADVAAMRMLRLFRLIRLLKLFKMSEMRTRLEDNEIHINLHLMRLVTLVCQLLYCAHLLGCGWFYTTWFPTEDGRTWLLRYDAEAADREVSYKYMLSVYWALTTLTTVGYGDVIAVSNTEIAYATGSLIISSLIFSYIIGQIGASVASLDSQTKHVEEKMDALKEYIEWRSIPKNLAIRMRRYYEHYHKQKPVLDEDDILSGLNPTLNAEVVKHVLQDNVGKLVLFQKMSLEFQQRAFSKLRPGFFKADEVIFRKGDASRDLLFLTKGEAGVLLRADETITEMRITPTSQYKLDIVDGSVTLQMRSEGVLGTDTLLGRRRAKTHVAISECEVFLITKEDLTHLLEHDPQSARTISRALMREIVVMDQLDYYASLLRINGPSDPVLCRVLRIQHHWRQYCNLVAKQDPLYLMLLAADAELFQAQARGAGGQLLSLPKDSSFRSRRHLFPRAVFQAAGAAGGFGGPAGGDAAEIKAMRVQMNTMLTMLESLVRSSRNTRLNERSSNSMPTPSRLPAPSPGVSDPSILGWMADSMSSGVDASTARRDLIMGRRSSVGSARVPSENRQKQFEDTSA